MTVQLEDPAQIRDLEAAGVQFEGRIESHWLGTLLSWVLPLVFVVIWGVLLGTRAGQRPHDHRQEQGESLRGPVDRGDVRRCGRH